MIYQLEATIQGTISETDMEDEKSIPLTEEQLSTYEKVIQEALDDALINEYEDWDMPLAEKSLLDQAFSTISVHVVSLEGKLKGSVQVSTVSESLTAEEEKCLQSTIEQIVEDGYCEIYSPVRVPEGWMHFKVRIPEHSMLTAQKKYEITDIHHPRYTWLKRIRALRNIAEFVRPGALGGFIESENNLSQDGNGWIYDEAICCEDAVVTGDARLFDGAMARGSALVMGDATLYFRAIAEDNCVVRSGEIKDEARIAGYAVIGENPTTGQSPLIQKHSNVYGVVNGRVIVSDNVFPGDKIENPTQDMFILENGIKKVLSKQRNLKNPEKEECKKEKQKER